MSSNYNLEDDEAMGVELEEVTERVDLSTPNLSDNRKSPNPTESVEHQGEAKREMEGEASQLPKSMNIPVVPLSAVRDSSGVLCDIFLRVEELSGFPIPEPGTTADLWLQLDMGSRRAHGNYIYVSHSDSQDLFTNVKIHEDFIIRRRTAEEPLIISFRSKSLGYNASFGKLVIDFDEDFVKGTRIIYDQQQQQQQQQQQNNTNESSSSNDSPSTSSNLNSSGSNLRRSQQTEIYHRCGNEFESIHVAWHTIQKNFKPNPPQNKSDGDDVEQGSSQSSQSSQSSPLDVPFQVKLIAKVLKTEKARGDTSSSIQLLPPSQLSLVTNPKGTLPGQPIDAFLFLKRSPGSDKISQGSLTIDSIGEERIYVEDKLYGKKRGWVVSPGETYKILYPGVSAVLREDGFETQQQPAEAGTSSSSSLSSSSSSLEEKNTHRNFLSSYELSKYSSSFFSSTPKLSEFDDLCQTFAWKLQIPVPEMIDQIKVFTSNYFTSEPKLLEGNFTTPASTVFSDDGVYPFDHNIRRSTVLAGGVRYMLSARCGSIEPTQTELIVHSLEPKGKRDALIQSKELPEGFGLVNLKSRIIVDRRTRNQKVKYHVQRQGEPGPMEASLNKIPGTPYSQYSHETSPILPWTIEIEVDNTEGKVNIESVSFCLNSEIESHGKKSKEDASDKPKSDHSNNDDDDDASNEEDSGNDGLNKGNSESSNSELSNNDDTSNPNRVFVSSLLNHEFVPDSKEKSLISAGSKIVLSQPFLFISSVGYPITAASFKTSYKITVKLNVVLPSQPAVLQVLELPMNEIPMTHLLDDSLALMNPQTQSSFDLSKLKATPIDSSQFIEIPSLPNAMIGLNPPHPSFVHLYHPETGEPIEFDQLSAHYPLAADQPSKLKKKKKTTKSSKKNVEDNHDEASSSDVSQPPRSKKKKIKKAHGSQKTHNQEKTHEEIKEVQEQDKEHAQVEEVQQESPVEEKVQEQVEQSPIEEKVQEQVEQSSEVEEKVQQESPVEENVQEQVEQSQVEENVQEQVEQSSEAEEKVQQESPVEEKVQEQVEQSSKAEEKAQEQVEQSPAEKQVEQSSEIEENVQEQSEDSEVQAEEKVNEQSESNEAEVQADKVSEEPSESSPQEEEDKEEDAETAEQQSVNEPAETVESSQKSQSNAPNHPNNSGNRGGKRGRGGKRRR